MAESPSNRSPRIDRLLAAVSDLQRRRETNPALDVERCAAEAYPDIARDVISLLDDIDAAGPSAARSAAGPSAVGNAAARSSVHPDDATLLNLTGRDVDTSDDDRLATIPGYQVVEQISRGGQGVVYRALQLSTKREVAIKVLRDTGGDAETAARRFEREIQLLAQFHHPNIVVVFDAGTTADGRRYFVMDFVRGARLIDYVTQANLTLRDTVELFYRIADAIAHAHESGIIHRDLKPSNILVDDAGEPSILDFGLAKQISAPRETALSSPQQLIGTLPYMSPEQVSGGGLELSTATDVYALGVMLYRALTGIHPYPVDGGILEIVRNIQSAHPAALRRAWSSTAGARRSGEDSGSSASTSPPSRDLEAVVMTALAKSPKDRYANAGELARDLRRFLDGRSVVARMPSIRRALGVSRAAARRYWPIAALTVWLLAVLLVGGVQRSHVLAPATQQLYQEVSRGAAGLPWEQVRLITLTADDRIEQLAAEAGLEGVIDAATDPKKRPSVRRLHAALAHRLAKAAPRAVCWEPYFETPSEYDDELAAAFKQLEDARIPVIVGIMNLAPRGDPSPSLSPKIRGASRWGQLMNGVQPGKPWQIMLALERIGEPVIPSLALQAVVAARYPDSIPRFEIRGSDQGVTQPVVRVTQWRSANAATPQDLVRTADPPLEIGFSTLTNPEPDEPLPFLAPDDAVAALFVDLPSDAEVKRIEIPYRDAFRADDSKLRSLVGGRYVVVSDLRTRTTSRFFKTPDGRRELPRVYVHVAAIEHLLKSTPSAIPTTGVEWLLWCSAATLGLVLGGLRAFTSVRRWASLGFVVLVIFVASIGLARTRDYFIDPLPLALLTVVACESQAAVRRWARGA